MTAMAANPKLALTSLNVSGNVIEDKGSEIKLEHLFCCFFALFSCSSDKVVIVHLNGTCIGD